MNSPPSSPLCADAINEDASLATGLFPFHLPGAMATVILSSPLLPLLHDLFPYTSP